MKLTQRLIFSCLVAVILSCSCYAAQKEKKVIVAVLPFLVSAKDVNIMAETYWLCISFPDTIIGKINYISWIETKPFITEQKVDFWQSLLSDGKYSPKAVAKYGRSTGADYVIYGNYDIAANLVIVQASLLNVSTCKETKLPKLVGPFEDVFKLERQLTSKIAVQFDKKPTDEELGAIIADDPDDYSVYGLYAHGVLSFQSGKLDKAIRYFNNALDENPKWVHALFLRGLARQEMERYDTAVKDFSDVIALKPDHAAAYGARGLAYYYLEKYDSALSDFNKAIELDSSDLMAICNRGMIYDIQEKHDLALADYNKVLAADPESTETYNNRSILYLTLGKYDLSLADSNKALEIDPNFAEALDTRANTYCEMKKYDLALADYASAIKLDPENDGFFSDRAHAYDQMNKLDLAIVDYTKAITLNPQNATAYNNRGWCYYKSKKYDLGLVDANKSLELDPKSPETYDTRARVFIAQGKLQQAREDIESIQKLGKTPENDLLLDLEKASVKQP